jgi:hypothetical protein
VRGSLDPFESAEATETSVCSGRMTVALEQATHAQLTRWLGEIPVLGGREVFAELRLIRPGLPVR